MTALLLEIRHGFCTAARRSTFSVSSRRLLRHRSFDGDIAKQVRRMSLVSSVFCEVAQKGSPPIVWCSDPSSCRSSISTSLFTVKERKHNLESFLPPPMRGGASSSTNTSTVAEGQSTSKSFSATALPFGRSPTAAPRPRPDGVLQWPKWDFFSYLVRPMLLHVFEPHRFPLVSLCAAGSHIRTAGISTPRLFAPRHSSATTSQLSPLPGGASHSLQKGAHSPPIDRLVEIASSAPIALLLRGGPISSVVGRSSTGGKYLLVGVWGAHESSSEAA